MKSAWISQFQKLNLKGSDPGVDTESMVSVKCKISFESRQDQLRVEREERIELWSSLLVGGIAACETYINPGNAGHLC